MFTNIEPLHSKQHANLLYKPDQPYHFAAKEILVPIVSTEFRYICREYPIVFPKTASQQDAFALAPQALLGIQPGRNLHVRETGHWVGRYVPVHFRRYPFIVGPIRKEGQQPDERIFAICIDVDAPHLSTTEGEPLLENGQPSKVLKQVQILLTNLHRDFEKTAMMVRSLDDAGLLVEQHLKINRKNMEAFALTGFRVIDANKLGALDAATLARLHKNGSLLLAYAHFISLTNLQDGLLHQAVQLEAKTSEIPDIDSIFGQDEDIFKFDV